jgi:hypothetical protein
MAYCINVLELQIFMVAYRSEILKRTHSFVQWEHEEEVVDSVLKCHFLCTSHAENEVHLSKKSDPGLCMCLVCGISNRKPVSPSFGNLS